MATTARTPAKPPAKAAQPRPNAWTGSRASPTFSAAAASRPSSNTFPPLAGPNSTEKIVSSLAGMLGTAITLTTKPNTVYHGTVTAAADSGITLNDVTQPNAPAAPMMPSLSVKPVDVLTWSSGASKDSFRTDTDISGKSNKSGQRELQAWQPDQPDADSDATFDLHSSQGKPWDQFAANETMFGVKTSFDEEAYTTKLDRSAADFKEKERKAQQLANDIMGTSSSNPHIQEERLQNLNADDSGIGEEDKYSSVTRGANAYVPPGARKSGTAVTPPPNSKPSATPTQAPGNKSDTTVPTVAVSSPTKDSKDKDSKDKDSKDQKTPADPTKAFRVFVDSEKERLKAKKTDLFKKDMNSKVAELLKFSQSFKLNKPIPDDLVPILAKDADKQRAIKEKSAEDAASGVARAIGVQSPPSSSGTSQSSATKAKVSTQTKAIPPGLKEAMKNMVIPERKPKEGTKSTANGASQDGSAAAKGTQSQGPVSKSKLSATGKPLIPMHIPTIPAFKGRTTPTSADAKKPEMQNGAANKALNINASSFKPNPTAKAFTPTGPSGSPKLSNSPKVSGKEVTTPNPFFGNRPIKKSTSHLKEDFSPFKSNRAPDASTVNSLWPYSGKRYMSIFPPIPQQSQQPPPQAQHPMPVPIPMPMGAPMMPHHLPPHMMPPPHQQPPQPNGQPIQNGQQPTANGQQPPQGTPGAMPPPYSEEDQQAQAAQAAQRGYMYANMFGSPMPGAPPVPGQPGAPGQPGQPGQPGMQQMQQMPQMYGYYPGMMPGMPPPPPGTAYAMPPFMPHMGYGMPPGMPPGQPMYGQPGMHGMPPQGYPMPPQGYGVPQGAPAPGQQNGAAPRPSMPPTPIPAHAHPYYQQSPQMGHAVPYGVMMPPPQGVPPPHGSPYEQPNGQAPQVGMGGHA